MTNTPIFEYLLWARHFKKSYLITNTLQSRHYYSIRIVRKLSLREMKKPSCPKAHSWWVAELGVRPEPDQLFCFNKFIYFIYLFLAALGLCCCAQAFSLVVASRGYSSLWCMGFPLRWLLLLWSMGSRPAGFSSCGSRALECRLSSCGSWA